MVLGPSKVTVKGALDLQKFPKPGHTHTHTHNIFNGSFEGTELNRASAGLLYIIDW